jgi:hypothetical protein
MEFIESLTALQEPVGTHCFKPGGHMATFCLTDTPDVDWATVNWDELPKFKYRHESSDGSPLAQAEFERRRDAGLPTAMWRFDTNDAPPVLVDQCNA